MIGPSNIWLIAGAVLLGIEAFGAPGIGFLFAGLAAVVTGVLVHLEILASDDTLAQVGVFFAITAVLAAVLWKKLKSWRASERCGYSNMIGDVALVGKGGLQAGTRGQVSWSGTTMVAEMDMHCPVEGFAEGAAVEIVDVKGNVLIVSVRRQTS